MVVVPLVELGSFFSVGAGGGEEDVRPPEEIWDRLMRLGASAGAAVAMISLWMGTVNQYGGQHHGASVEKNIVVARSSSFHRKGSDGGGTIPLM